MFYFQKCRTYFNLKLEMLLGRNISGYTKANTYVFIFRKLKLLMTVCSAGSIDPRGFDTDFQALNHRIGTYFRNAQRTG